MANLQSLAPPIKNSLDTSAPSAKNRLILAMRAGAIPTSPIPSNDVEARTMWRRAYQSSRSKAHKSGFKNAHQYLTASVSQGTDSPVRSRNSVSALPPPMTTGDALGYLHELVDRPTIYPPPVFYGK